MAPTINVIGIGNPIMSDDGIGLEILERLRARALPGVNYIDGGTSGMEILPDIQDADYLLVLDGLKAGEPGSVHTLVGDQIPRLLSQHLSPHQVGLLDLLSAARLLGKEPREVAVVGVVAADLELKVGLSELAKAGIDEAVEQAEGVLKGWI